VTILVLGLLVLRRRRLRRLRRLLHGGKLLTRGMNVLDRADDLTDLLVVRILALNLIFKVLFESLVLKLDLLQLLLEASHNLLLRQELLGHLSEGALFIFLNLLHALINRILAVVQLLIFVFQVNEAAAEAFNAETVVIVYVFIVSDHLFQEVRIFAQVAQLALPVLKLELLFVDVLPQLLDCLLVLERRLVKLLQTLVFLFALRLVLHDLLLVCRYRSKHLSLPL